MDTIILNFHGIGTPHAGVEADERPYWVSRFRFEEVLALVLSHPARHRILFTFDDGNVSDLDIAAPALAAAGLSGDFFLLTGRFGQDLYLGRADAQALQALGMRVGLHGRDHVDWTALDEAAFDAETRGARAELQACLGSPVDGVAIPFGRYNARVIRGLKRREFRTIYTSDGGAAGASSVKSRTSVREDMSLDQVRAILDGRESPLRRARRTASVFLRRHLI